MTNLDIAAVREGFGHVGGLIQTVRHEPPHCADRREGVPDRAAELSGPTLVLLVLLKKFDDG